MERISAFHSLLHQLLPQLCLWCQLPVHQPQGLLCDHCNQALPLMSPSAQQVELASQQIWAFHVAAYETPWCFWLQQWKFQQDLRCGLLLKQSFRQQCWLWQQQGLTADAVAYVPCTRQRLQQRGFNQALELAEQAALCLQLPLWHGLVATSDRHQVGLNRQQRWQQSTRFAIHLDSAPRRLLLIDDVMTTGSTCHDICVQLFAAGVSQIMVCTLLRVAAQSRTMPLATLGKGELQRYHSD